MMEAPSSPARIRDVSADLAGPSNDPTVDDGDDAAARAALELVSQQLAAVKTVKNGCWLRLAHRLAHPPVRTSFSLPPPTGRMHLYGQVDSQCAGILFDRRMLNPDTAYCWPSGYFAKTEQHLQVDESTGEATLTGGMADCTRLPPSYACPAVSSSLWPVTVAHVNDW